MKRLQIQSVRTKHNTGKICNHCLKIFLLVLTISFFELSKMTFGQVRKILEQKKIVKEMRNIKRLNILFLLLKQRNVNPQQMNTEVEHNISNT